MDIKIPELICHNQNERTPYLTFFSSSSLTSQYVDNIIIGTEKLKTRKVIYDIHKKDAKTLIPQLPLGIKPSGIDSAMDNTSVEIEIT